MATAEQLTFYKDNGYLVIEDFLSPSVCQKLKAQAKRIVADFFEKEKQEAEKTVSVFTTNDQTRKSDDFFLSSGDKLRCFYEERAIDKDRNLLVDQSRAINKIGHALGELDDVFREVTVDPKVVALARQIMREPLVAQTMYIFKNPGIGGEVNVHQDSTFINTRPMTCQALWFALDDVTKENGCLWVIPKSHTSGITERFVRNPGGPGTVFIRPPPEQTAPWSSTKQAEPAKSFQILKETFDGPEQAHLWVPLPCKAGSVVLIHGEVVHKSAVNTSDRPREVYTFHMIEKDAEYPANNWLQRSPDFPFQSFEQLSKFRPSAT